MRLLVRSAMVFFGTLMAAGLLALAAPEPGSRPAMQPVARASAPLQVVARPSVMAGAVVSAAR
jgi:hypothetical protein